MTLKFMGKKKGMTQLFDKDGNIVVCTVIQAEPNVIVQVKTKETDGYSAVQIGFDEVRGKRAETVLARTGKPLAGHFEKASVKPRRFLKESRVKNPEEYTAGQELTLEHFLDVDFVDMTAYSKGKGYQGVMKLHNFSGGPASHGSGFHRHAGSTGMRSTPGRCFPNGKRASHMGDDKITVQNLKVVRVVPEDNLLIVKGSVPGPQGSLVCFSPAVKLQGKAKKKHK